MNFYRFSLVFFLSFLTLSFVGCGDSSDDFFYTGTSQNFAGPARLAFLNTPSRAINTTFNPVLVGIFDDNGQIDNNATNPVTISIINPGGATLSGTTTVNAQDGVAVFRDLSIDQIGNYTFNASSPGLQDSGPSAGFTVTSGEAATLTFLTQPSNNTAGQVIAPPIQVQVRDSDGNSTDAMVNLVIGNNPSLGVLGGTVSQQSVNGVASFDNITVSAAGTGYTLNAAVANGTNQLSDPFDVNPPVLASNAGTRINDVGNANCDIGAANTSRNIAVDDSANLHAVFVNMDDNSIRYTGSTDNGANWSTSQVVNTGGTNPIIAAGPGGHVYIAFVDGGELNFSRSTDGGLNWSTPSPIAGIVNVGRPSMATFGNNVYITSYTGPVDFVRSTDNGASFDTPIVDVLSPNGMVYQDVVVDPNNGDVFVVGDNPTVFFAQSTDGGANFGAVLTPGAPALFYSDFTATAMATIVGVGSGTTINVIDTILGTSSTGPGVLQGSDIEQRATATDASDTVFYTRSVAGLCSFETSDANGTLITAAPVSIGPGTFPDVAANPRVLNAGMLYNNGGNIIYFAP